MSELVTLNDLVERIGIPETRARRLLKRGLLTPDFRAGRMALFHEERVPELQRGVIEATGMRFVPQAQTMKTEVRHAA